MPIGWARQCFGRHGKQTGLVWPTSVARQQGITRQQASEMSLRIGTWDLTNSTQPCAPEPPRHVFCPKGYGTTFFQEFVSGLLDYCGLSQ